jgi:hypothetical protein
MAALNCKSQYFNSKKIKSRSKQEFHFLLSLAYTEQYLKSTFKIEFFVLLHINYKVLSTHICGTGCDE